MSTTTREEVLVLGFAYLRDAGNDPLSMGDFGAAVVAGSDWTVAQLQALWTRYADTIVAHGYVEFTSLSAIAAWARATPVSQIRAQSRHVLATIDLVDEKTRYEQATTDATAALAAMDIPDDAALIASWQALLAGGGAADDLAEQIVAGSVARIADTKLEIELQARIANWATLIANIEAALAE